MSKLSLSVRVKSAKWTEFVNGVVTQRTDLLFEFVVRVDVVWEPYAAISNPLVFREPPGASCSFFLGQLMSTRLWRAFDRVFALTIAV